MDGDAQPGAGSTVGPGGVVGVALAAGAGTRLRPLTLLRPKPLCPVDGRTLLDRSLDRFAGVVDPGALAVNVHHGRDAIAAHLGDRAGAAVHVSVEEREALGTAGALGHLRGWIDGRAVLVVNSDTVTDLPLAALVDGWDGERVRLLAAPDPGVGDATRFGPRLRLAGALLPWREVAALSAEPSGLYEVCWRAAHERGALDVVVRDGRWIDAGTPASYLAANLACSGGRSVVEDGAVVADDPERPAVLVRSVVWRGARVAAGERLVDAVRAGRFTVLVRATPGS